MYSECNCCMLLFDFYECLATFSFHFSGSGYKRCAKKGYIERASDELEDDNPSNAISDDEDEDEGSTKQITGSETNSFLSPEKNPPASKNTIGDNMESLYAKTDDKSNEDTRNEDEEDKDNDTDKNKKISNGEGIDIIQLPKRNKEKKEGKQKKKKHRRSHTRHI